MAYTWQKELTKIKNPYLGGYADQDLSSVSNSNAIPVNSTIKPLTGDDVQGATSEIEAGEVVLHPDGKVFRALGKKHVYGGTPVNLPDNSFIFSDHKPLAIGKEDHELFDFKTAKSKAALNTPAKVIKREIDIEHHNRMIAIQGSDDHDDISKKSSELMLQKNMKKLGQVAFLQEEKKGFPQGLPQFSDGSAPIENPDIQKEETMAKQYGSGGFMQLGGPFQTRQNKLFTYDPLNPAGYVPPQWGLWKGDKSPAFENKFGQTNASDHITDLNRSADNLNYQGPKDNIEFQKWLYNSSPENRAIIDQGHENFGQPHFGNPAEGRFDGKIGTRWQNVLDQVTVKAIPRPKSARDYSAPPTPSGSGLTMDPNLTNPQTPLNPSVLPYEPNVPFTGAQKLSLAADAFNLASINKYAPKRMQESFTPVNLERVNAQPYLNQINNQVQQAYGANQLNGPIQGRAANSQIFGRALDQTSQTLGNIDNQNRQISNQENMYNNQGTNRTASQNVQLDNTYYNQVQAMNQNYDNESRFARNRLSDKYMEYRSTNDALEMQLASQPTFGTVWVDPKTGQKVDTQGMDEQTLYKKGLRKQAAPLYDYNSKRNSIYFTGAGLDINNLPGSRADTRDKFLDNLYQKFQTGNISDAELRTLGYISKSPK